MGHVLDSWADLFVITMSALTKQSTQQTEGKENQEYIEISLRELPIYVVFLGQITTLSATEAIVSEAVAVIFFSAISTFTHNVRCLYALYLIRQVFPLGCF